MFEFVVHCFKYIEFGHERINFSLNNFELHAQISDLGLRGEHNKIIFIDAYICLYGIGDSRTNLFVKGGNNRN